MIIKTGLTNLPKMAGNMPPGVLVFKYLPVRVAYDMSPQNERALRSGVVKGRQNISKLWNSWSNLNQSM